MHETNVIDHALRNQITPRRGMRQGHVHVVVRPTRIGIRAMRRGQSRCGDAIDNTESGGGCDRARLLARTLVAGSYRRCSLGRGIRTCLRLFPELYPPALRRVCYYFAPPPASVVLRPRRSFVPLSFVKFDIKRRNTWGGIINRITLQRSGRRR